MELNKIIKNKLKKFLLEQKTDNNFLYHGTHIKNLDSIKKYGLLPDFGEVVKSSDAYQYYMDDEYFSPDDRVDGLVFLSDDPNTWSYSHYGETPNIDEAILCLVKKNPTIYRKFAGRFYDINGKVVNTIKYNNYNYLDIDKLPPFIEDGDFFSLEEQEVVSILYDDNLKKFVSDNI